MCVIVVVDVLVCVTEGFLVSSSSLRFRETMFGEGAMEMDDVTKVGVDKDKEEEEDERDAEVAGKGLWRVVVNGGVKENCCLVLVLRLLLSIIIFCDLLFVSGLRIDEGEFGCLFKNI